MTIKVRDSNRTEQRSKVSILFKEVATLQRCSLIEVLLYMYWYVAEVQYP